MKIFSPFGTFFGSLARPYPARDWFIALAAAFFFFLGFALYGVSVYVSIATGSLFTDQQANQTPAVRITRGDIKQVLDAYDARVVNWNAHNFPAPPVADPSGRAAARK